MKFVKFLIANIFSLFLVSTVFAQTQAEVAVTSTFLRKSPDANSEKIQTVQSGEKIVLEKKQDTNGFYFVAVESTQNKGWIRKDTVRILGKIEKPPTKIETKKSEAANQTTPKNETVAEVKTKPKKEEIQKPKEAPKTIETQKNEPPKNQKLPKIKETPKREEVVKIETIAPSDKAVVAPVAAKKTSGVDSNPPTTNAPPAQAQTPVEDDEVLRVDTAEVSLNVRVVNDKNRPVGNLNQAQFEVYEDNILQPITAFTTEEVPVVDALVIDNSRSLRSQLTKIIEAGKIIVGANRPKDETMIVRFVSKDKIEIVQNFTPNKNALGSALDNLFVEGGQTAIIDAIYQTAKQVEAYQNTQKKDDVKLRTLILVSDGDDRASSHTEQELFKLLRESNVQIYAIGFIDNLSKETEANGASRQQKAEDFLKRLAQETGGKIYFPESIEQLSQIAQEISGELRTQYSISYAPTNSDADGSFRQIKVVVADGADKEKRTAITRTGRNSAPK